MPRLTYIKWCRSRSKLHCWHSTNQQGGKIPSSCLAYSFTLQRPFKIHSHQNTFQQQRSTPPHFLLYSCSTPFQLCRNNDLELIRGFFLAEKAVQSDINELECVCYLCRRIRLQQVKVQRHRFNTSCKHYHVSISYLSEVTAIRLALRPFHPEAVQFYMHWTVILTKGQISLHTRKILCILIVAEQKINLVRSKRRNSSPKN